MKTAVLLSGHPKTYEDCWKSFNNSIDIQHDTYSHMWWDRDFINKCYKMHSSEIFDNSDLSQELIRNFNVNQYLIEKEKSFDLSFCKKFNLETWGVQTIEYYKLMTPILIYGILCQTYSVLQSFLLAEKSGSYDVIIKSRPDLIITKSISAMLRSLDLSGNKIYFQSSVDGGHKYAGEFPNKPCDWFFVSSVEVAKKFIICWHNSIVEKFKEGVIHTNEFVKIICKENNLDLRLADFNAIIYKQTTNYYDLYRIKMDKYIEDFDFDSGVPRNLSLWPYWIKNVNFAHFKNFSI